MVWFGVVCAALHCTALHCTALHLRGMAAGLLEAFDARVHSVRAEAHIVAQEFDLKGVWGGGGSERWLESKLLERAKLI